MTDTEIVSAEKILGEINPDDLYAKIKDRSVSIAGSADEGHTVIVNTCSTDETRIRGIEDIVISLEGEWTKEGKGYKHSDGFTSIRFFYYGRVSGVEIYHSEKGRQQPFAYEEFCDNARRIGLILLNDLSERYNGRAETAKSLNEEYGLEEAALREEGGKSITIRNHPYNISIVDDPDRKEVVVRVEIGDVNPSKQGLRGLTEAVDLTCSDPSFSIKYHGKQRTLIVERMFRSLHDAGYTAYIAEFALGQVECPSE